jgi:hypothetical protein
MGGEARRKDENIENDIRKALSSSTGIYCICCLHITIADANGSHFQEYIYLGIHARSKKYRF